MKTKKWRKIRQLLLLFPVILLAAAVLYGYFSSIQPGTLIVRAITSDRYFPQRELSVFVSVDGRFGTTPLTLSVSSGSYNVTFHDFEGYQAPPSRLAVLPAGKTVFAVGVYNPIVKVVRIGQNGFNSTSIAALHGVTPVVWVNRTDQFVIFVGDAFGRVIINPSQNFTYIYQNPGQYNFWIDQSEHRGTVSVA